MLIDTVYYSKILSADMVKMIINKLKSMGSKFFRSSVSNISMPSSIIRTDSEHITASVGAISKAIEKNRKITFFIYHCQSEIKRIMSERRCGLPPFSISAGVIF